MSVAQATQFKTNTMHEVGGDALKVDNVSLVYRGSGKEVHALDRISFESGEGEFLAIVGPSGCGKSTLLKAAIGLFPVTEGAIRIYGETVTGPRKDIGMVFQAPVLLPWRTVVDNVLLPVQVLKYDLVTYTERARSLLELVGLSGFETMYPHELSGGMQQRAAIARALVCDPPLLLMDEPFGALDALTREQMNLELQRIWSSQRKTILFVTHSISEAVFLADRIIVMSRRPGRVLEIISNPLPRQRTLDDTVRPEFGQLVQRVRKLLGSTLTHD